MIHMYIVVILAIFVILLVIYLNIIIPFQEQRSYIKMEMKRSTGSRERAYWKKELKELYMSFIPFYAFFKRRRGRKDGNTYKN